MAAHFACAVHRAVSRAVRSGGDQFPLLYKAPVTVACSVRVADPAAWNQVLGNVVVLVPVEMIGN
jgi:hypothetical protein